ncbi:MAG: AfsR/SARP family transcriptional regulator, partial [Acidimicrobiales bacterium]
MEIRILGPLEVSDGGCVLELGGVRQRVLLARLAVSANRVVPVDTLLDELWGSQPPAGARQALQAQASRLRKVLGDPERLVARAPGYVLRLGPDELDAARFEALLAQARAAVADGDRQTAARRFAEADGLWRGPVLAEFADSGFAQAEAARLGELRLGAIEARMDAELDLGRHDQVVAELGGWRGLTPTGSGCG